MSIETRVRAGNEQGAREQNEVPSGLAIETVLLESDRDCLR
jgi:hypothetical protein